MYTGTLQQITNDQDYTETFELVSTVHDFADWEIEYVVVTPSGRTINAAVSKDVPGQTFTATIPLSTVKDFCPGQYRVGCRYVSGGLTTQIVVATLPVIEGNFTP